MGFTKETGSTPAVTKHLFDEGFVSVCVAMFNWGFWYAEKVVMSVIADTVVKFPVFTSTDVFAETANEGDDFAEIN